MDVWGISPIEMAGVVLYVGLSLVALVACRSPWLSACRGLYLVPLVMLIGNVAATALLVLADRLEEKVLPGQLQGIFQWYLLPAFTTIWGAVLGATVMLTGRQRDEEGATKRRMAPQDSEPSRWSLTAILHQRRWLVPSSRIRVPGHFIVVVAITAVVYAALWLGGEPLRQLDGVRVAVLVFVLFLYLYGLVLLVVPMIQGALELRDPMHGMLRDMDQRLEGERSLMDWLSDWPAAERGMLAARLDVFIRRVERGSSLSQWAVVLSPVLALVLQQLHDGDLSSLMDPPMVWVLAFFLGVLLGMLRLGSTLAELESIRFCLRNAAQPPTVDSHG